MTRSTLPLVLARYGRHARGRTPSTSARSTHSGANTGRPDGVEPITSAGIPVGEDLGGRPAKVDQALSQQPQRRRASGIGGKAHRDHPGEPQDSDQGMQGAQLFPDQPPAAVGPVRLDLHARAGLKAHLGIGLPVDRAQHPNPAGERGIGAHIAKLLDLPIQRRGPQLGMGAEPAGDVGRLRLGEFRRPGLGRYRGTVSAVA
jgi:hypothetical protein